MSKVFKAIAGAVLIVAGVVTGHLELALLGLSLETGLLQKKPPGATGQQTNWKADPYAGLPILFGRTQGGGYIVYRHEHEGPGSAHNDLETFVTVYSIGPVQSFDSYTANNVAVTFDGSGAATGDFAGWQWQKTQLGACPESSYLTIATGGSAPPGWTTAHKLSGLAAAMLTMRFDSKGKHYQTGETKALWVIKGVKAWDPRLDSTWPGGSGTQRWNDETTWAWSENPFVLGLTWCIGYHQNGKRIAGIGRPPDAVDVAAFVEGANIADTNGWTCGGEANTRPATKWAVLKQLLQAGGGEPTSLGGRISCIVNTPRVSLATVGAGDIVGEASLAATQPRKQRINQYLPSYRSEDHNWEVVPAAMVRVDAYVAEDSDERTRNDPFDMVQDVDQATQLAAYEIVNSRELGPGTFPLKPRWLNFKAGDCVDLELPDATQKMMIVRRALDPATGIVTMTVRSETDAKHDFALGRTGTPPPTASLSAYDPSVPAPAAGSWAITATSMTANGVTVPTLVVEGACENPIADAVVFWLRPYIAGSTPAERWELEGTVVSSVTKHLINTVTPGTVYEVGVSYRMRGVIGARLILSSATSGPLQTAHACLSMVTMTVDYPLTSDDDTIYIAAFSGIASDGNSYSFPSGTRTGLDPHSSYEAFWNIPDSTWHVISSSHAADALGNSNTIHVGAQYTLNSGVAPTPPTPPAGFRNFGGRGPAIP